MKSKIKIKWLNTLTIMDEKWKKFKKLWNLSKISNSIKNSQKSKISKNLTTKKKLSNILDFSEDIWK